MLIQRIKGFTVVEILIVIVVIGILAGLGTVGYRGLKARAQDTELKSDVQNVSEQIELAFIKDKAYPANLSALGVIPKDPNTTLAYVTTGQSFCLTATSTISGSKTYSVVSDGKVTEGNCATAGYVGPPSQPTADITNISTNSFMVSWPAANGATSYSVRYGTSNPPSVQASTCSGLSCTISGLATNTTYYVTVSAVNSAGTSVSVVKSARTGGTYTGPQPGTIVGCAVPSGGFNAGWPTSPQAVASEYRLYYYGDIVTEEEIAPYDSNWYVVSLSQGGNGESYHLEARYRDAAGNFSPWTDGTVTAGSRDCYD